MVFEREDWTLFRSLSTLTIKAGVHLALLGSLVVKEIVDNALDAGLNVTMEKEDGWIIVTDDGPGIPVAQLSTLFSIKRPLTSSKVVRLPTRGALGNGLRVVMGAVFSSSGDIEVETSGVRMSLVPQNDGSTKSTYICDSPIVNGTRVRLRLGESMPGKIELHMAWATIALTAAKQGKPYKSKSSPHWYDLESMFELLQAAGETPAYQLLSDIFHKVSAKAAKEIVGKLPCRDVERKNIGAILLDLRRISPEITHAALGCLGDWGVMARSAEKGVLYLGVHPKAAIPYQIEVYMVPHEDSNAKDAIVFMVNRTPITGTVNINRSKPTQVTVSGCGLYDDMRVPKEKVHVWVNITTPYMPITSDGKAPALVHYADALEKAFKSCAVKCRKANVSASTGEKTSQKEVILQNLSEAQMSASGDGEYIFSLRRLFYAVRPFMLEELGKEPDYNYFASVITDYEANFGDINGLYRDPRGVIYHPHTGEEIPLGTQNVDKYRRPDWTFNKIIYFEKEGLFPMLRRARWPEKHDCALMTSKGFASRAARDLLDLLGDSDEEIWLFCVHDADPSGTLIYQSLQEATRARARRRVHIVNLGLEPEEALDMGLKPELYRADPHPRRPVANYVHDRWDDWLQTNRVELDAIPTEVFFQWLDRKMQPYTTKIIPPKTVMMDTLVSAAEGALRKKLAEKILAEAGFDDLVNKMMETSKGDLAAIDVEGIVHRGIQLDDMHRWDHHIQQRADRLAGELVKKS